ncbi:MAG: DUF1684 domain-containing protein [Chloroflexota bacterium]
MMPTRGSRLESFRKHKDDYYGSNPDSPIEPEDRVNFAGLRYFPEDEALRFELPLDTSGPGIGETLVLDTSSGETKTFKRAGRITCEIGGTPVTLSVLTDASGSGYFLPFTDITNGQETYSRGRFLDPTTRPNGDLVVDFNYAYNPYCAYGEGWSCAIPPAENRLTVAVRAGEMQFPRKG